MAVLRNLWGPRWRWLTITVLWLVVAILAFWGMTVGDPTMSVWDRLYAIPDFYSISISNSLAALDWRIQLACLLLMGWGFYMIHGCIQVFASELSVEARATALSLHSFFFFLGQTLGPIAYGFGIAHAGKIATLLTAGAIMIALGFACAKLLRQRKPGDIAAA